MVRQAFPLMHVLTEAVRFMKLKNFLSTVTIKSNFRSGRNSLTVDSWSWTKFGRYIRRPVEAKSNVTLFSMMR